jgi:hypothetical protein
MAEMHTAAPERNSAGLDIDRFVATYWVDEANALRFFTSRNAQFEHKDGALWLLLHSPLTRLYAPRNSTGVCVP